MLSTDRKSNLASNLLYMKGIAGYSRYKLNAKAGGNRPLNPSEFAGNFSRGNSEGTEKHSIY